jgi:hypothetical protein
MVKQNQAAQEATSDYDAEELESEDGSLLSPGAARMIDEIVEHNSTGPELAGRDLDADWQSAGAVGDEAVGGHAPTPDQDEVDAIGRALGVEQEEDDEVQTHEEILSKRDRDRWELDRRSADQESETS